MLTVAFGRVRPAFPAARDHAPVRRRAPAAPRTGRRWSPSVTPGGAFARSPTSATSSGDRRDRGRRPAGRAVAEPARRPSTGPARPAIRNWPTRSSGRSRRRSRCAAGRRSATGPRTSSPLTPPDDEDLRAFWLLWVAERYVQNGDTAGYARVVAPTRRAGPSAQPLCPCLRVRRRRGAAGVPPGGRGRPARAGRGLPGRVPRDDLGRARCSASGVSPRSTHPSRRWPTGIAPKVRRPCCTGRCRRSAYSASFQGRHSAGRPVLRRGGQHRPARRCALGQQGRRGRGPRSAGANGRERSRFSVPTSTSSSRPTTWSWPASSASSSST